MDHFEKFSFYSPSSATEASDLNVMFPTGVTSKTILSTDGEPKLLSEHWLYLTAHSQKLSRIDQPRRKSAAETERLLRQLGLMSKNPIDVVIEFDPLSIVIRPL